MKKFKRDEEYIVNGAKLDRIRAVAKRLYSENELAPNEYRDLAQRLEVCLDDAVIAKEKKTDKRTYHVEIEYSQTEDYEIVAYSREEAEKSAREMLDKDLEDGYHDIVDMYVEEQDE
jgi:hypothetical protein